MRTNMVNFGKRTPFTEKYFEGFIAAYNAENRLLVKDERFSMFTRESIASKGDNLDIGLISDDSLSSYDNLPAPIESAEEAIEKLKQAISLLNEVVDDLRAIEVSKDE